MNSFQGEAIRWSHQGKCLEVELHRAPCNEIGRLALGELEKLVEYIQAGADGAQAVLFHSTTRRGFCAGADLRELHAGLAERRAENASPEAITAEAADFIHRIHAAFNALDTAPLITIAAVHGVCFGGGFELALTADLIVADKSARFCFPELRLGIIPAFGGLPRLRRDAGNQLVRDLLFTGRSLNASKAQTAGIVSQVVARGEALRVARLMAEQATRFDTDITKAAKAFVKPLPLEELEREKEIFLERLASDVVFDALDTFVNSEDTRPYLP